MSPFPQPWVQSPPAPPPPPYCPPPSGTVYSSEEKTSETDHALHYRPRQPQCSLSGPSQASSPHPQASLYPTSASSPDRNRGRFESPLVINESRAPLDREMSYGPQQAYSGHYHPSQATSISRSEGPEYPLASSPNINKERFNSPLATNRSWAPSHQDAHLTSLPIPDMGMRIKQRFARSPGNPFQPEAPSFQRPVPNRVSGELSSFGHFDAFALPGKGKMLGEGFKALYPGRDLVDHDVSSADWERFLEDIEVCGRLSGKERLIAGVSTAPLSMAGAGIGALIAQKAIEKRMKTAKEPVVVNTVETWSQRFFLPRGLDVFLVVKGERASSVAPEQPLPVGFEPRNVRDLDNRGSPLKITVPSQLTSSNLERSNEINGSRASISSSSSSSSSSNSSVEISKQEKATLTRSEIRDLKKERKAAKKEARKERREARKERNRQRRDARKDRKKDKEDRKKDQKKGKKSKKKDGVADVYLVVQPAAARGVTPGLTMRDPFASFC